MKKSATENNSITIHSSGYLIKGDMAETGGTTNQTEKLFKLNRGDKTKATGLDS